MGLSKKNRRILSWRGSDANTWYSPGELWNWGVDLRDSVSPKTLKKKLLGQSPGEGPGAAFSWHRGNQLGGGPFWMFGMLD